MKKLGSRGEENILGGRDHRCKGPVAGASMCVLGNDSGPEWLECRGETRVGALVD